MTSFKVSHFQMGYKTADVLRDTLQNPTRRNSVKMPPTPGTCGKARSSQLSSQKKGGKLQKTLTSPQSTGKVRKCSLRLRNLESSQPKEHGCFSEVLKCMAEDVRRGTSSSKGENLTDVANGLDQSERAKSSELTEISRTSNRNGHEQDHVANNRTSQVSNHGNLKARTKKLLSMRVALTDVELGSAADNTLFKTGVERKNDLSSATDLTDTPRKRNTNIKGSFPYTGIGRPSKYNIPTVSISPGKEGVNSNVNKTDGMEFQTCKIAKLRGNGSAIEWIQVDLTEASINDYIKSKKAKLAEEEKMASGGRKKEKTYYVTGNVVENSTRQGCNKKVVPKNSSKTSNSLSMVHVVDLVENSNNRKKHLRSHSSAAASVTNCQGDNLKEQTPLQKSTVSDNIDTTVESITLDDEVESKPNNCKGQNVFYKEEQEQTSEMEAHNKEIHPEVRGQHRSTAEVEGLSEISQQRDNKNQKHSETVVQDQASEQDKVNSEEEQVPLQNSNTENHSETVPQAVEQNLIKDYVKVKPDKDLQQHQQTVQKEEITRTEQYSETDGQVRQVTFEDDDTAIINEQETTGKGSHSTSVVHDRQQQQVALEDDNTSIINEQETTGKGSHSTSVVHDRQQQQVALEDDNTSIINEQETTGKGSHSTSVVHDRQQQQVALEEDGTAETNQQETTGNETDPKTSAQVMEANQVASEDEDIPGNQGLETLVEAKSSEMAVEDNQEIKEEKDVPAFSQQEMNIVDPSLEEPLTCDRQIDSAMVGPTTYNENENDSDATDVYSFTEDNSTHGTNVDLGALKTMPDPIQHHSVKDGQMQSTDVGQSVQTLSTDTNITVPDYEPGDEYEDVETASVDPTPAVSVTSQEQTMMTEESHLDVSEEDTMVKEVPSLVFEETFVSQGTSPHPDVNELEELPQISPCLPTDLSQGDREYEEALPYTCSDITSQTPDASVFVGEAPDVTSQNEIQVSGSVNKMTHNPQKRGPGRPRKIRKVEKQTFPGKDVTVVSCPMLQPINIPPKRGPGRPRKIGLPAKERPALPAKDYPIRSRVIKRGRGRPRKHPRPSEHSHVPGTNKNKIPHINQQLGTLSKKRKVEGGEDLQSGHPPAKRRKLRPRQPDKTKDCPRVDMNQATKSLQQGSEESECLEPPAHGTRRSIDVASEGKNGPDSMCEKDNKERPILAHEEERRKDATVHLVKRRRGRPPKDTGKVAFISDEGERQKRTGHLVKRRGRPPKGVSKVGAISDNGEGQRDTSLLIQRRRGRPPSIMGKVSPTSDKGEGQKTVTSDPLQAVPKKYTLSVNLTRINHQLEGHLSPTNYANNKTWNDVSGKKRKARELIARSLRLRNHRKSSGRKEADTKSILTLESLRQSAGRKEVSPPIQNETPKKKGKSPLKCRYSMALLSCSQCDFATIEDKKMEQHREKTGHMAASSASLGEMEQETPNTIGRVYKCSNCSYKNKKKSQVLRHKAKCDKNLVRVLRQVPQSSKEEDVQSSIDIEKSSQSYLTCNKCPFKTLYKHNLMTHKEHHNTRCKHRRLTCQLCSYGCNRQRRFRKHMQLHKQDKAVPVESSVSWTVEQANNVLESDKTVSTGDGEVLASNSDVSDDDEDDDVKEKCPHCPFETHVPLSLELHIKHHKDICPNMQMQCKFCTFVCKTKTHMTRHMKLHKVATEPLREENHLVKNSDVQKQAFYAYDFDLNQENCPEKIDVHATVTKQTEVREQHVCVKCTMVFRSRYRLLVHKIQHETGTYLRCEECKFRTKKPKKYQFLAHLNAHFNMKPYKCKYCPYRAGCYHTVFKHILKSHNNKMQHSRYKCNKCSFSCKGLGWLKRHQKLHLQGHVAPTEGNKEAKYDIEVENIIVCGKYKQKKMKGQDEIVCTTEDVSSTTIVSPQKHAGISCVREVQNTTDGSVEFWFLCRFCGKMHLDQESWFAHVQRHIISSAWHPKNALSSQPAQKEETFPTIGCPRSGLHVCPGEEVENRQHHVVMEKHRITDGQSEDALDKAEECSVQDNVDATATQKCGDGKEWSSKTSLQEDLEETAECSASSERGREEDAEVTGDQLVRVGLNATDSTFHCRQDSNSCGHGSALDTDDDSDLPPLLKTTNELELAFVFPPDKQAELIREHLVQYETSSIGSADNPVPSLQEIKPEGQEEPIYLPQCDYASSSGSMLGSSEDRLSSVGNLTADQKEAGPDLSGWISALQYNQTSEVEGAICAKVPGLPPGKTIRCQFCGQQFACQLKFLQHAKRHLL
uniref:C2H2-type domain-containing protein n=1 Tax=Branchiostoma floridae TaxID=7739 RepID=C3Y3L4_BRAFL|eukprot:XP_002608880.1 hypothetical protein BRAFLDRAFT_129936 [Branchiostoma floridae]